MKKLKKKEVEKSLLSSPLEVEFILLYSGAETGMVTVKGGDSFDVEISNPKINITDSKFSGTLKVKTTTGNITMKVHNIEYDNFDPAKDKALTKMVEQVQDTATKAQEAESEQGDIPQRVLTVSPTGEVEIKDGVEQKSEAADAAKVKALKEFTESVDPAASVFDKWTKDTIGSLKERVSKLQAIDHDVSNRFTPHFIGIYQEGEKKYIPLSTPHENYNKQYIVIFDTEKIANFIFAALKSHPEFANTMEKCKIFPVTCIDKKNDDEVVIVVKNGLLFLNSL